MARGRGLALLGFVAVAAAAASVGKRRGPSPFVPPGQPEGEDSFPGKDGAGILLPPAPVATTLAQVIGRVVAAAASRDPAVMRAEAKRLRAEGWPAQAGDLDELAMRTESLQPKPPAAARPAPDVGLKGPAAVVVAPPVVMPSAPPKPPPVSASPLPGIIPAATPKRPPPLVVAAPVAAVVAALPAPVAAVVTAVLQTPRVLRLGATGADVKTWQILLNVNGAGLTEDGNFGPATDLATRALQKSRGILVDGIVGPETLTAVALKPIAAAPIAAAPVAQTTVDPSTWRTLQLGMAGKDVGEWQLVLQRDGFPTVTVDDKFGPQTKVATVVWQKKNGLTADGIVGALSRAKIAARPVRVAGDLAAAWLPLRAVSPLPGIIPEMVPTEQVAPERALAAKLAQHLTFAELGAEDRHLISLFQTANGLNATGAYGPGTGEALMGFGLIPPRVRYWPSKGTMHAKARYKAALLARVKTDPQRALEWSAAARQVETR